MSTPLCHYRRTRLLFMEKSVRTHPPRGDHSDCCVPAHGNTHPIPARGGGPLKPAHSPHPEQLPWPDRGVLATQSPVVTRSSANDFLGMWLWFQPCLPTLDTEGCVRVPCSWVLVLPGSFYLLHVTRGSRAYPGLTRPQGHKRVLIAYLGPQLPERGAGAAVSSPLCAWRLGKTGDPWQRRRLFLLAPPARSVLEAGTLPSQAPPSPPSYTPPR